MLRIITSIPFLLFTYLIMAQEADVAKSNAIIAEGNDNYKKAAGLYKNAIELYSSQEKTDTFCIFKAGQNYVRVKEYETGVKYLKKAETLNYNNSSLYLYLADGYNGLKNHEKAEFTYKKGMELYPEEKANYLKKLSYFYYNIQDYEKAINSIDEALIFFPANSKLLYLKGNSLGKQTKYDEAINVFNDILTKDSENKKAINKLGVMIFKKTDVLYKKEIKRYEKIKNPDRIDYHQYKKNLEQINLGYKNALPYLEKARASSPNDKLILNCLLVSYSRLKMTDKYNEINAILK